MRRFRFHIGSLLILVVLLGVGFAALREADELWDSGVFTLTLGVLQISILVAVHRAESKRAFWVGFALFGWGYIVLAAIPAIEPRLLTTKALAFIDSQLPDRPGSVAGTIWSGPNPNPPGSRFAFSAQGNVLAGGNQQTVWIWDATTGKLVAGAGSTTESFMRIGHSLLALILAWLGGKLSRHFYVKHRETHAPSPTVLIPGVD